MDIFAKSLAPVLGYPEAEVVRWLEAVFQKIAEELVLNGEVRLAELGVLRRVHIPSEPREVNGKLMLVPPRHEVRLIEKESLEGGLVYEVALEQLQLEEEVAQKFSKGFARVIKKVVDVRGSLQLGELGEFVRAERGSLMFKQSTLLSELLDKPFVGLSPVIISGRRESTPASQSVNQSAYSEPKVAHVPESSMTPTPPATVDLQEAQATTEVTADRMPSDIEVSFLKSPALSPSDEPMSFAQSKDTRVEEEEEPVAYAPTMNPSGREPLFIVLAAAAAAKTPPESEDERDIARRKSVTASEENGAPFRYEAAVPTRAPNKPFFDDAPPTPVPSSTEDPTTWADDVPEDKEAPVLRNIAIATAIVFFTIIIAFIVMKYESISFTPPAPPAPVDRAKLEAEKAAAARAEAERILAEKSIPKKTLGADSSIKVTGTILKNITKAAKDLPKELTTIDLSKGGYTIIVASQPTREAALLIVEEFGKLGLAATVMEKQVGKAIRYRVRVGQFETAAEANVAKKKYKSVIPSDAFLDKVSPPAQ
jgi:hypothetical protein